MDKGFQRGLKIWLGCTLFFLFAPIIVIILMSFNQTDYGRFPFVFTTQWYTYLFTKSELLGAFTLSLIFASCVAAAAIIIGTITSLGMQHMKPRSVKRYNSMMQLPITIPWLVQAISILLILNLIGVGRSYIGMFFGNLICVLPYVVMLICGRFSDADRTPESAARLLGAKPLRVFFDITLPMIMPGILSGGMMAFMVCFNSFVIQYYLAPFGVRTLPMEIFTLVKTGYKADLNALATITILISVSMIFLMNKLGYSGSSLFGMNTGSGGDKKK